MTTRNAGGLSRISCLLLFAVFCLLLGISGGPAQAQDPTVFQNLPYYGPEVSDAVLDVYAPGAAQAPYPTIVYITPMANTDEDLIRFYVPRLNDLGYAVVSVRIRPEGHIWQDSFCGLAWVHANASNYNFDPSRIVAFGISGSGMTTATFATIDRSVENPFMAACPHPEPDGAWVQGVVAYEGLFASPVMLAQSFIREESARFSGMTEAQINDFYDLLIETPTSQWRELVAEDTRRWLIQGYPLYWGVDGDEPPFLLIYGGASGFAWMVDEQQFFAGQLAAAGVPVEVVEKARLPHSVEALAGHTEEMDAFLAELFGRPAPVLRRNLEAITPENASQVEELAVYQQGAVCAAAFGPDGNLLAATGSGELDLLDVSVGRTVKILPTRYQELRGVAFSPDGTYIATSSTANCGQTRFSVWDVASGTLLLEGLEGFEHFATDVAFSADGKTLAVSTGCAFNVQGSATVKLWDVETQTLLFDLAASSWVSDVEFSPDGSLVAAATGDGTIHLWDVATGTVYADLQGHSGSVSSINFSPDGTRLISGEYQHNAGPIQVWLWDMSSTEALFQLDSSIGTMQDAAFSTDGQLIVTGSSDGRLTFWDAATGALLAVRETMPDNSITSVAFNQDSSLLATCGHDELLRLWGVRSQ